MKRVELLKSLAQIAAAHEYSMSVTEGKRHPTLRFDGVAVTTILRHRKIARETANGILEVATTWKKQ
ncbi:hypothetical protein U6G28_03620 [Actinomycetaceae bacterium MB13-C1-2]|nr:hypothetical protein U6G28_03620 [Actinomycetaceae bacterium MB13-C1-2]